MNDIKDLSKLSVYFDGSITKNPNGKMHCGVMVFAKDKEVERCKYSLDESYGNTCNIAEWAGLQSALQLILELNESYNIEEVKVYGDSRLVINGIKGKWKVRQPILKRIFNNCKRILNIIENHEIDIYFEWIPREINCADEISRG